MQSQLRSTRLFNENYFAFRAALSDLVAKGVRYVVLPGDFSDDGQPVNVKAVKGILDEYSQKYGLEFFITTGNHDPVRPFTSEGGKVDFMGIDGRPQPVMSKAGTYSPRSSSEHPVVVTSDIQNLGYREIISLLSEYGFFPKSDYLYWETPFSTYDEESYDLQKALGESSIEQRMYEINPNAMKVPDVSYLVEPVEGIWLLAIDANVYIPKTEVSDINDDPLNYNGTGIGYNQVLTHKQHIVSWVQSVAGRAAASGKTLVAFSHYPMVEYYDGAGSSVEKLFGPVSQSRIPSEAVAQIFADAGICIHFGGHMHINDTGFRKTAKGNTLLNVQVPSLAAYPPAYKLLTLKSGDIAEIETVIVDSVQGFDALFELYRIEYDQLINSDSRFAWNNEILDAPDYYNFVKWHLRELIRLRLFPGEWPAELRQFLSEVSGMDLLILLHAGEQYRNEWNKGTIKDALSGDAVQWEKAMKLARQTALAQQLSLESFNEWTGSDLVTDFYLLGNGDQLARLEISQERFKQYELLHHLLKDLGLSYGESAATGEIPLIKKLELVFEIMESFTRGEPSVHFNYNMKSGEIMDMYPALNNNIE
jgi:hypothetical protein